MLTRRSLPRFSDCQKLLHLIETSSERREEAGNRFDCAGLQARRFIQRDFAVQALIQRPEEAACPLEHVSLEPRRLHAGTCTNETLQPTLIARLLSVKRHGKLSDRLWNRRVDVPFGSPRGEHYPPRSETNRRGVVRAHGEQRLQPVAAAVADNLRCPRPRTLEMRDRGFEHLDGALSLASELGERLGCLGVEAPHVGAIVSSVLAAVNRVHDTTV
jgi:hypothetical protein